MTINRQWTLKTFPEGLPEPAHWHMRETAMPEPDEGEILLEALFLDIAPYMRGRISPQKNYAAGVGIGDVMVGGGIGRVLASRSPDFEEGELAVSDFGFGWQTHTCLSADSVRKIDGDVDQAPAWLDILGLNGVTAYFGLFAAASMQAGDTVVVSAAAGSVGQYVGQLAKIAGGRAIAVASTEEKIGWCREIGFDEGIAYRHCNDLPAALKRACPEGVDVFFDNTGGSIHDAVMLNLAQNARITICGTVSLAGRFNAPDIGQRFLRLIMVARARVQGFLVIDYADRYGLARKRLKSWLNAGQIETRYDFVDGFERQPDAFCGLFVGDNLGKRLVRV